MIVIIYQTYVLGALKKRLMRDLFYAPKHMIMLLKRVFEIYHKYVILSDFCVLQNYFE